MPAGAVVQDPAGAKVWVVENGKLIGRPVTLGRTRGGSFEVNRGLSGGESVVLKPTPAFKDGLKVRVAG